MGKLLGLFLIALAIASVLLFIGQEMIFGQRLWWFPKNISEHGDAIDSQFGYTLVVVGISFFAAQVALGYIVMRYGRRGKGEERANYTHGSNKLEITWTLITAAVFVGIAILGQQVWASLHLNPAPPDAVKINVVAQQFQWNFHYPGADGVFGRTDPTKINDSSLNYVGLDTSDPNAKDDTQVTTLAIPQGRAVELTLRSKDVIHSFWVPSLRFKQDTVPGLAIKVHFTAKEVGKYELTCVELCGQLHYNMKSFLVVLPQADFDSLVAMPEEGFKERLGEFLQQYN
jgi:cytochrome c oxidase subunit 2